MRLLGLLIATLFVPIIPWIILAVPWVARDLNEVSLYLLVGSGAVLDLWWGTPLGLTALFLLGITLLTRVARDKWPADARVFTGIAMVVSLILMEIYLVLI